ncbi:hypothetical protein [Streptomyces sp. NPDC002994]|uniref:DUF4259 domain-containing protein n=1 Tax=Streptomyces sp. NPDC002994 TaxID=3154441 RepID=UPI0033A682D7
MASAKIQGRRRQEITTNHGRDEVLPVFAEDLKTLAVDALDRVLAKESELAELRDDSQPKPKLQEGPLFTV